LRESGKEGEASDVQETRDDEMCPRDAVVERRLV
jgi:hypothetical protein